MNSKGGVTCCEAGNKHYLIGSTVDILIGVGLMFVSIMIITALCFGRDDGYRTMEGTNAKESGDKVIEGNNAKESDDTNTKGHFHNKKIDGTNVQNSFCHHGCTCSCG